MESHQKQMQVYELLDDIYLQLAQTIDMLDVMILHTTSNQDSVQLLGPLEILKRDLFYLTMKVDETLEHE